ncbi:hypothetical protein AALB39_07500 [Lachnospiraceae bacterium 54-53]
MKIKNYDYPYYLYQLLFTMFSINALATELTGSQLQEKGIVDELADGYTVELKDRKSIVYQLKSELF